MTAHVVPPSARNSFMHGRLSGLAAAALVPAVLVLATAGAAAQQSSSPASNRASSSRVMSMGSIPSRSASSQGESVGGVSSDPVMDALRSSLKRSQENLMGAANEMPAEKYGYAPTPEQMSFGKLVLHVAESNDFMCATIAGTQAPERSRLEPGDTKEKLVAALEQSFQFCDSVLANVTDSALSEEVPFFGGRKVSRATAVLGLAEDWGDHYSLAATELRLNGLLPPTAKRGEQ